MGLEILLIAKAILFATKHDLREAAGFMQLCAGQLAGIKGGVHAMKSMFQRDDIEAVLLVDASSTFSTLDRHTALFVSKDYVPHLPLLLLASTWPFLYMGIANNPLAMPMYALATIRLIKNLKDKIPEVNQIWLLTMALVLVKLFDYIKGLVGSSQYPWSKV